MDHSSLTPKNKQDIQRFEQWATTYDRSVMQKMFFGPIHRQVLDFLQKEIPDNRPEAILDVGCGTGRLLKAAAMRWPEAQIHGVDPAEQMISRAARLNPAGRFQVGTAENLPLPDQSANLAFSSLSFHHWSDHQKGIQEITRVLRPGGWFCLVDHAFLPVRLLGENVRSRNEIQQMMIHAGLLVRKQKMLWLRWTLISLAQKPEI